MNEQFTTVKDAAAKAASSAVDAVKSAADRAPKVTMPTITIPQVKIPDVRLPEVKLPEVKSPAITLSPEVQSYVDAASKSATQASQTIRTNVSSTVTLLREAIGR